MGKAVQRVKFPPLAPTQYCRSFPSLISPLACVYGACRPFVELDMRRWALGDEAGWARLFSASNFLSVLPWLQLSITGLSHHSSPTWRVSIVHVDCVRRWACVDGHWVMRQGVQHFATRLFALWTSPGPKSVLQVFPIPQHALGVCLRCM